MPLSISTLAGGKKEGSYKHIEIEWVDFIPQLASYCWKLACFAWAAKILSLE